MQRFSFSAVAAFGLFLCALSLSALDTSAQETTIPELRAPIRPVGQEETIRPRVVRDRPILQIDQRPAETPPHLRDFASERPPEAVYSARYADGVLSEEWRPSRRMRGEQPQLEPLPPLENPALNLDSNRVHLRQVVVKLRDGSGVRARNGELVRTEDARDLAPRLARAGLEPSNVEADVGEINRLVREARGQALRAGELASFAPVTEAELDMLRRRAESASRREMADLNTYLYIFLPETNAERVGELVAALVNLRSVEFAYPQPISTPPADIPPTTTIDMTGFRQGFHGPAPAGIDVRFARNFPGANGQGVRVVDIEQGWYLDHEDLQPASRMFFAAGFNIAYHDHGTAVLGQMWAEENAFGVDGMIQGADMGWSSAAYIYPFYFGVAFGYSDAVAMQLAARALRPGDIILIEAQHSNAAGFTPVEFSPFEFQTIEVLTAAGIIVVEAAGNGGQRFDRGARDSGAIMVGARPSGSAMRAGFSNFGTRVDVHAWGNNIQTLGYGIPNPELRANGPDPLQWYQGSFGGTSGASPIVTSAAAIIQSTRTAAGLQRLTPAEMRALLVTTGTPQLASDVVNGEIGAQPNLAAALATYIPDRASLEIVAQPSGPVAAGQPFAINARVMNTGTRTWTGQHNLSIAPVNSNQAWNVAPFALPGPMGVGVGREHQFALVAPGAPGTYLLAVEVRTALSGGYSLATRPVQIIVSQPGGGFADATATIVSAPTSAPVTPPAVMSGTVTVRFTNTGNVTFTPGAYSVRLSRSVRIGLPMQTAALPRAVAPGDSVDISFQFRCNGPGFSNVGAQLIGPGGAFGAVAARNFQCV